MIGSGSLQGKYYLIIAHVTITTPDFGCRLQKVASTLSRLVIALPTGLHITKKLPGNDYGPDKTQRAATIQMDFWKPYRAIMAMILKTTYFSVRPTKILG